MLIQEVTENVVELVEKLNFAEKVDRSLELIDKAYKEFGDNLVVANSLGKDSSAIWHLAKRVSPKIRGFIVTTRFKPKETKQFMTEEVANRLKFGGMSCYACHIFTSEVDKQKKFRTTKFEVIKDIRKFIGE